VPPHYIPAFDNYPLISLDEKRALLAQAVEENLLIAFGHDPNLAAVSVRPRAQGFEIAEQIATI
jgi:hypothetical protein